jgi:hypothetical protein
MIGNPLIYEAALAAAEFFFMGGALTAYLAMYRSAPGMGLPALAGIAWALAIGCQFTQIIAVAVALAITTAWILRAPRDGRRKYLGALPNWVHVSMLVALAWQLRPVQVRVQFGYRYQLAVVNLHERLRIFQPIFAIPNLSTTCSIHSWPLTFVVFRSTAALSKARHQHSGHHYSKP